MPKAQEHLKLGATMWYKAGDGAWLIEMQHGRAMKDGFLEIPASGMSSSDARNLQRQINSLFLATYMDKGPAAELARSATAHAAKQEKARRRKTSQHKSDPPEADQT
jgi:hypothetical protein